MIHEIIKTLDMLLAIEKVYILYVIINESFAVNRRCIPPVAGITPTNIDVTLPIDVIFIHAAVVVVPQIAVVCTPVAVYIAEIALRVVISNTVAVNRSA